MPFLKPAVHAIVVFGLATAMWSPAIALASILLLAVAGIVQCYTESNAELSSEDTPRELRLIHFGFWFFPCIMVGDWLTNDPRWATAGDIAPSLILLLFWPLVVSYSRARVKAGTIFLAIGLFAVTSVLALLIDYQTVYDQADWTLVDTHDLSFRGLGWLFLLFIPGAVFGRYLRSKHRPAAILAATGLLIVVTYLVLGINGLGIGDAPLLAFYLLSTSAVASTLFVELDSSYTRQRRVSISATVITMNEEHHIADCLRSARLVADEIIVLDSGSSDRTVEIARQYADSVEVTDWPGFGVQKQRALERATGDWVLSLDADERISAALAREINHCLATPDAEAYKLPWAVTIYGKRLDFGRSGRAPLRLFRREGVRFSDALVHERILIPPGRRITTLRGRLVHYTHRDYGHSLEKSAKYAWLGSQEKHRRGKKTKTMVYPTFRGLLTFVQIYFVRFGFLDGAVGYLTAVTYAQVTFNKYAGLWTLGRE